MAKVKKPSRLQDLTDATAKKWAHRHSLSITDRKALLNLERDQMVNVVFVMESKIKRAKARIADIDATTAGLDQVLRQR